MKAKPVRIILAFYPLMKGQRIRLWKSLSAIARVCVARPDARAFPRPAGRYEILRLEGEAMVIAETQPANVESVVKILQLAGSPAIFVVRAGASKSRTPASELDGEADPGR